MTTTNLRGAVTLRTSRTEASNIDGSTVACAPVTPTKAQKLLIASDGKPRRRNAVNRIKFSSTGRSRHGDGTGLKPFISSAV
uniref:CSON008495 protein n=1 Tax=Culicoides sonorensis TaxID=179676 RepID=A0A336M1I9_CULSO